MIRKATSNDIEAVYELIKQLSSHSFTKTEFEESYTHYIEKQGILICEKGNTVLGAISYDIHCYMHFSGKSIEVVNLIVDEECRSQGIGKILLDAVQQIAENIGCEYIEVDSGRQREKAHNFYKREGFELNHFKFTKRLDINEEK